MAGESESPTIIREAGNVVRHAHFARPGNRTFPREWEDRFDPFFKALADIQYSGRLSIEAFTADFIVDGQRCLDLLRQAIPNGTSG